MACMIPYNFSITHYHESIDSVQKKFTKVTGALN